MWNHLNYKSISFHINLLPCYASHPLKQVHCLALEAIVFCLTIVACYVSVSFLNACYVGFGPVFFCTCKECKSVRGKIQVSPTNHPPSGPRSLGGLLQVRLATLPRAIVPWRRGGACASGCNNRPAVSAATAGWLQRPLRRGDKPPDQELTPPAVLGRDYIAAIYLKSLGGAGDPNQQPSAIQALM